MVNNSFDDNITLGKIQELEELKSEIEAEVDRLWNVWYTLNEGDRNKDHILSQIGVLKSIIEKIKKRLAKLKGEQYEPPITSYNCFTVNNYNDKYYTKPEDYHVVSNGYKNDMKYYPFD